MVMCYKDEEGLDSVRNVEVIGLLQYGLKMTTIKMDVPVHYVHRVTRTKNVEVPSSWENLPDFRKVLYMVLSVKAIISRTMNLKKSKVDDDNDSLEVVMEPPEADPYQLPLHLIRKNN